MPSNIFANGFWTAKIFGPPFMFHRYIHSLPLHDRIALLSNIVSGLTPLLFTWFVACTLSLHQAKLAGLAAAICSA